MQAKAKLWAAQTKISVSAEVKIFLSMIDAIRGQTGQVEKALLHAQKHTEILLEGRKKLEAQSVQMVPVLEMRKALEEKEKTLSKLDELSKSFQSTLDELEAQKNKLKVLLFWMYTYFQSI